MDVYTSKGRQGRILEVTDYIVSRDSLKAKYGNRPSLPKNSEYTCRTS